jgi:hypothetical protein
MYYEKPEMVSPPAYLQPAEQTAVVVQPDAEQDARDEYADPPPIEVRRELKSDNLWWDFIVS